MEQDELKMTGTPHTAVGSAKPPTIAKSVPIPVIADMRAKLMTPSTGPEHRNEIRKIIRGPVTMMSNISLQSEQTQLSMWTFWLDTLECYSADMIREAFDIFVRTGKRFVSPPDIVAIIEGQRRKIAAKLADAKRIEQQRRDAIAWSSRRANRVTAEKAQEIIKAAGIGIRMAH